MARYSLYRPSSAPPESSKEWGGVFPAVNLYESADAYVLTAEIPGVAPADLDVSLEGDTLTLGGQRKIDYASQKELIVHRRERPFGSFRRAVQLPAPVDAEKIDALHRNGVLSLRLPKRPEHQPRRIPIRTS